MCWLSQLNPVLPGERLGCRVLAASIHLMVYRLSQLATSTGIAITPENIMLHFLFDTLWRYAQKNPEDVWKIFETVIVDTPIFKENATDSRYEECSGRVLDSFQFVHHNLASHIRASSSALMCSSLSRPLNGLHSTPLLAGLVKCRISWHFVYESTFGLYMTCFINNSV